MAADGRLMFETGIDNSGFSNGVSNLQATANVAMGNIAANMVSKVSSAAAQIPQQIITVGSGFEASMSQVAATMGITSAAAEFKTLSAAAKEMGETTKFSASQAGEALNYLALAGYDANKAVAALPTVLNVAAAGGMELASASDMVTDAMSALGLETSQMADFSDKLAVTAQKSNTSVSQLGEAILTVGGTAKMLSGGVTEMNTALGILADNGIKGSEGGTALRNVILSLSAPTDTAAAALESLGVTAFDASGSMRPLEDTFADLNTALSTLSDQERTAVLNEIFNKVDLKSVNALLGTSSERFDELSGYISDCAGAAAQMAETMDDNLKGDLTIMQSALEGLGIAAYEKFQVPFRDAVQEVTGYIGDLSLSIADGNLSASVEKISVGFGSLAESAIKIVGNNVIPTIASGLEIIVDHANSLKIIISLVTAEFVAMKAAAILTPIITSITAANTALTLLAAETSAATFQQAALASGMSFTEIAVGLFTGKITAATAAEAAFNAVCAINPVVLLATALAALGVAIGAIVSDMKNATEETNEYAVALENARSSAVQITKDSDKEIAVIQRKSERYEELRQRFEELTDGEMAEFLDLVEELQGILPEGTKIIDEQSGAYLNLADNIEKVTERMHLQAALSAKYEEYSVAASNYYDIQEKLNSLESSILPENRLKADPEGILSDLDDKSYMNQLAKARYGLSYDELVATQKENKKILEDYDNLKEQTYAQIENSDSASSLSVPILPFINSNISRATEISGKIKGILNDQQKETTSALESAWKQAEHAYATGVIATEAELYRQKSALLEQYGNADLEDHWKYYEDLYTYQKESAENSIRLAEEAAREQADIRDQEWNNIAHRQSLGLLSAEDAYRQQLAFIKKYCPEYSDEWYNYYQMVLEYQRDAQQKQVDSVKDGISELVAEYKSAYKELESERNSYKNRLMSVGSLFGVETETDENGNTSKIVSVENLRQQMAEMQKYHDYITKLKSQGATDGFIGEMASMDFEDGLFTAENLANMSESEFNEINELYKKKEELADKLSGELFEPELNELNEGLVNGVLDKFGTLPPEIQEIGAESLAAFIAGLTGGDLSEQVDEFAEKFASDCAEGIQNSFAGTELDYAALMNADAYSIGKNAGDEYAEGFNEALAQIQTAIAAEQNFSAASTAPKRYSETVPQTSAESSARGNSSDRIVIRNHIEVDMDGEKVAEKVIEKEEIINYRKGE